MATFKLPLLLQPLIMLHAFLRHHITIVGLYRRLLKCSGFIGPPCTYLWRNSPGLGSALMTAEESSIAANQRRTEA